MAIKAHFVFGASALTACAVHLKGIYAGERGKSKSEGTIQGNGNGNGNGRAGSGSIVIFCCGLAVHDTPGDARLAFCGMLFGVVVKALDLRPPGGSKDSRSFCNYMGYRACSSIKECNRSNQ